MRSWLRNPPEADLPDYAASMSGFENPEQVQRSLFDDDERERQIRLDAVADQIKERFGTDAP